MDLKEELKMEGFSSPYQKVLLNLMFTGAWWEAKVREALKEFGLTEQQYNVLRILKGQKGKPLNLYMIQERMIHRTSNATRIVERLRKKGCVERVTCPSNRRQVEVSITSEGERVLEEAGPAMKALEERIAEAMGQEQVEELNRLLEQIRNSDRNGKGT